MNKKMFRLISALIGFAVVLTATPTGYAKEFFAGEYSEEYRNGGYDAGYDPNYDCNMLDDQEVKVVIDDSFAYMHKSDAYFDEENIPSGWDVRTIGGDLGGTYYHSNWVLKDKSDKFPVEATRKFEMLDHGYGILEFIFTMPEVMNDVRFEIYKDTLPTFGFETKDGKLYMRKNAGQRLFLCDVVAAKSYGVKADFDIDGCVVKNVYINGVKKAENMAFENSVDYINNFNINTGDKTTGNLRIHTVQLYRGYKIYDRFMTGDFEYDYTAYKNTEYQVSAEYSIEKTGGAKVVITRADEASIPDSYHLTIDGASGSGKALKSFGALSGKQVFEAMMYLPQKSDGAEINLLSGGQKVASFTTENGGFSFNGQQIYEDYMKNVWYKFKAILDLDNHTADVYLNNRLVLEWAKINGESIDTLSLVKSGSGKASFDRFMLYQFTPEPEDYCPEPVPALNSDYIIGMQFCPMWKNGTHIGWDSLNADRDRVPYIGYYDEGNPEVNDWIIKQLVEHGISFQKVMWCGGANMHDTPQMAFIGGHYLDGLMQAKYKDMMKFYVCWENQAMGGGADDLVNNIGPYWIENYLKNDNYLKIDGRPVVAFYSQGDYVKWSAGATDAEKNQKAKEGLEKFRQLCIERGVGNPILTINSSTYSAETAKELKDFGWDLIQPYFPATGTFFEQGMSTERQYNAANEAGIWQFPTYGNGIDGSVWQSNSTGYIPNSVFKEAMEDHKSLVDKREKDDPFYKYMMLETYDEYGEGHYVVPSGRTGFSQFDIIREVFVDDKTHEDVVPTMKQKNRFNNLYPYGRNVPKVQSGLSIESIDNLEVKKGWYFDEDGDLEGWKNDNGTSLQVVDGCLVGTQTAGDPHISTTTLVNADEAQYLKLKMKIVDAPNRNVQIFFGTVEESGYSEAKSIFTSLFTEEFEEKLICMAGNTSWTGTVTNIRIDPISINTLPEDKKPMFYIDSIELLGPPASDVVVVPDKDKPGFKISVDNVYTKPNAESITENGRTYFPLRAVAEVMGAERIDYDEKRNEVNIIKNDNWVNLKLSSGAAFFNGGEVYGDNPFVVRDGVTYLNLRMVNMAFAVDAEYDADGETLKIVSDGNSVLNKKREIIASSEFDFDGDAEGYTTWNMSLNVSNGTLSAIMPGETSNITKNSVNLDASKIKNIKIKYKNASETTEARIYFITNASRAWGEDKRISVKVTPNATDGLIYDIDPTEHALWSGTITSFRFDPCGQATTGSFEIDYIRFEGDFVEEIETEDVSFSHITNEDGRISWEFNSNGTPDGWNLSKSLGNVKISDGYLTASVVGTSPELVTYGDLNINAEDVSKIKIKLKNNTKSTKMRLYFRPDTSDCYCDGRIYEVETYPYDTVGEVYEISTKDNPLWKGVINGLKLEAAYNKGDIAIDYIRLEK